ncbi:hypothetical protein [Novipirellula artificiosorum]|uniref:DUF1579 domain-containing protein n=1 Tax=Novipirellula artificiosorum TaxID=2528016 RepID=A0A5C6D1B2_9BACT|nr:hypothetical protein [Novipirellula artificiosorum]TWU28986.1 hypothetical protein Poly41_67770 [Novipirellula artificiosorum]
MRASVTHFVVVATFILATGEISLAQNQPNNHDELNKHLGWVIGEWSAEMTAPDGQVQKTRAKYQWVAQKQVIRLDLEIGPWEGLSMIHWDPSDRTIKMWGANSAGGNGQATMRVAGEDLVWTNTVYDMDGKKTVSDFVYQKQDARTMLVKYTDAEDGKQKTVKCSKIGD